MTIAKVLEIKLTTDEKNTIDSVVEMLREIRAHEENEEKKEKIDNAMKTLTLIYHEMF